MKKIALALSLSLATLVPLLSALATEPRIGEVVQQGYNGAVAEPQGAGAAHAIAFSDNVFALDTVKTEATASTEIRFLDDTTLQMGGDAEVHLDSFVYDPSTSVGASKISFAVGAFRYVGGKMSTEEQVRLHTPTATMVIRGTELVVYVWPSGRSEVNVVAGAVEVSACGGGTAALATTGMQITVLPNCTTQLAAASTLPAGLDALSLPDRSIDTNEDREESREHGHRGEGDSPRESGSPSNSEGSGHNSPPEQHI